MIFVFLFVSINNLAQSQTNLYDLNVIQQIKIYFSQPNWDFMLDTAKLGSDSYILADSVIINGVVFDTVGVKYKGNSTYDSTYAKNSLHISLDEFKSQNYMNYKDIKLNNVFADPSFVREVLSYKIINNYMFSPKANFAQVFINDEYFGVFTNVESVNKKFCSDNFGSSNKTFIKGNPIIDPSPNVKSNLKFKNSDSSSYFNYYEMKSSTGWNSLVYLCDTITNYPLLSENILDIDKALWMLAFDDVTVNLDSYLGAFAQNYYLYRDATNRFNFIIWDLNMNFGAFPHLGSSNSSMSTLTINQMKNLSLIPHINDAYWPLIKGLLNIPKYKKIYYAHIKTIVEDYFANGLYLQLSNTYRDLIDEAVYSDTKKFFTNNDFDNAMTSDITFGSYNIPGIENLMSTRTTYIQNSEAYSLLQPEFLNIYISNSNPYIGNTIIINATISNANEVKLFTRTNKYEKFVSTQMFDDGNHNDQLAGDGIFGVSLNINSLITQYYIYAENSNACVFSPQRAEFEFYTINASKPEVHPKQLVINEFMASNTTFMVNEYGTFEDWIELYNNSLDTIDLYGLYFSDDFLNPQKFAFPEGFKIAPRSFIIVWADEKQNTSQFIHSNFKLSKSGEQLIISNASGIVIDSLTFGAQTNNKTTGRCPDGTGTFSILSSPTFNYNNCPFVPQYLDIVINEFMASNTTYMQNEYGQFEDWIELYNNTNDTVDLNGMYLSDTYANPQKFAFPSGYKIAPYGFLKIWADENAITEDVLHCNFKLSKNGEQLILTNSYNQVIDSLSFGVQLDNISTGRCPDGTGSFVNLSQATLGYNNYCEPNNIVVNTNNTFIISPNPANEFISISCNTNLDFDNQIIIYNNQERIAYKTIFKEGTNNIIININNFNSGFYFINIQGNVYKLIICR